MADLVPVALFASRPEALIARSVLESAGLFAVTPDLNILGSDFDPAMSKGGYRVLVRDDQLDEAKAVLRDVQRSVAEGGD